MDSPFCCLVRLCLHPFYRFGAMAVELFCQGKTTRKAMYIKRYLMMCDVFFLGIVTVWPTVCLRHKAILFFTLRKCQRGKSNINSTTYGPSIVPLPYRRPTGELAQPRRRIVDCKQG